MTSQPYPVQPPRTAMWLVDLFAIAEDTDAIMGDLLEEFSHLAAEAGVALARQWYWRQALKTIAHLVCSAYRVAPWSTSAAVAGGFLLRGLVARLPGLAIFAVLEKYHIPENHFSAYVFFATTGIDIGQVITFLFVGWVVAFGAKGREMAATVTLGLIFAAMAIVGSVANVTRTGDYALLWGLVWYFTDAFAVILGGAIVRTRSSVAA
jgi:hypothetical protein